MAPLEYCLSTGFVLNIFFFLITSLISRVFPYCRLFKEALSSSNVLLFLVCLDDSGRAFSPLIFISSVSLTVNITDM